MACNASGVARALGHEIGCTRVLKYSKSSAEEVVADESACCAAGADAKIAATSNTASEARIENLLTIVALSRDRLGVPEIRTSGNPAATRI